MRSRTLPLIAAALVFALVGAACGEAEDAADQAREAAGDAADEAREVAEGVQESVDLTASFELSGEVTDADIGRTPDVDVPGFEGDASEEARQPDDPGLLQVEVSEIDDVMASDCGTSEDDVVEVFWTTRTFFDPADVLEDATFAENLQGRTVTATGRFGTVDVDIGDEEPDDNPCVLVAGSIEVGSAS